MTNKLNTIKQMTAAKMFLLGIIRLGEDIRDNIKWNYKVYVETQSESKIKVVNAYSVMVGNYNSVMALNLNPWN